MTLRTAKTIFTEVSLKKEIREIKDNIMATRKKTRSIRGFQENKNSKTKPKT